MSASDSASAQISPKSERKSSNPFTKRRLRLGSGLVLFAFVVTHLANHILGLISLEAMEAGRHYFLLLWRNPVGTTLFVGSLLIHMAFALHALYSRRRLKMRFGEAAQLILGFAAPVLLISHILGTRAAVQALWHRRQLYLRVACHLGRQPGLRTSTSRGNIGGLDSCLYRALLLASPETLVHADHAGTLFASGAVPGAGTC